MMRWTNNLLNIGLSLAFTLPLQLFAATEATLSAQAEKGKSDYQRYCTDCHLANLRGSGHGPELFGKVFADKWNTRSTAELGSLIMNSMPPGGSVVLDESQSLNLVAYILQV